MPPAIAGYEFDGPHYVTSALENRSGVYVILHTTENKVLDAGESADVRNRVETHDRKDCWELNRDGWPLRYAAHYTPNMAQGGRKAIEKEIRDKTNPPCGTD